MQFLDYHIGKQIRKPSGILGRILGYIMAADHKALTQWTLEQLQIEENDSVLDIGCGSGMAIEMINNIATKGYVVGIDYSPVMVKQAIKKNKLAIKDGKTKILQGNVSELPFADASFDKICAIETFYFWPDPPKNLQEVKRVMKPGGIAAFAMEISKEGANSSAILDNAQRLGFPIYSGQEMKSLLVTAGFVDVSYKVIPEREKGWLCAVGSIEK
jgi:ubiquinone/menaquinone biosynthesis C-methylase UbiE